eukprot:COSAG01_NODE_15955_length_1283_cov_1.205236_1_plen_150_part_00
MAGTITGDDKFRKVIAAGTDGCSVMRSTQHYAGVDGNPEGDNFLARLKEKAVDVRPGVCGNGPHGMHCSGHIGNLAMADTINDPELDLQADHIPFLRNMTYRLRTSAQKTGIYQSLAHPMRELLNAIVAANPAVTDPVHGWKLLSHTIV